MRRYETIFIMDPDVSEEGRTPVFEKLEELVPQEGGFIVEREEWGVKKLAYDIKKKNRGYYVRLDYCGSGALVDEVERFFRIDDRLLKYMTIVLDKEADVEGIQAEMQAAREARAEAETADKPATDDVGDEAPQKEETTPTDDTPAKEEEE